MQDLIHPNFQTSYVDTEEVWLRFEVDKRLSNDAKERFAFVRNANVAGDLLTEGIIKLVNTIKLVYPEAKFIFFHIALEVVHFITHH